MNERTKTGLRIAQVAIVVGLAGDVMLRVTPWGLNVLVFNLIFVGAMFWLIRKTKPERLTAGTLALFGAQIFFASMFVWRDSIELRVADTIAILACLAVLFVPRMKVASHLAGFSHYAAGFIWSAASAFFAPFILAGADINWSAIPISGWKRNAFSVLRGLLIAVPLVLIFGALFMAADAAYEGLIQRTFNFDADVFVSHIVLFSLFAWLTAGYLRGALVTEGIAAVASSLSIITDEALKAVEPDHESKVDKVRQEHGEKAPTLEDNAFVVDHINRSDPPNAETTEKDTEPVKAPEPKKWDWANLNNETIVPGFALGTVEITIVLGLMNLLFLSFVIVQVPYLFGGMEMIQSTPDLKLADYARRGFGELVAVSVLVLPVLLLGHWLIKKDKPVASTLFKVLASVQIGLLFVIMVSAGQRLFLLTGEFGYGLTTVRLYPMIIMIWLAVVFVWFGVTVLRGYRQYFAWGALWSAFFILGSTHVLNPDAFIVRTNIALMKQGRDFDAYYNSELSDDSISGLVGSFSDLDDRSQRIVLRSLARRNCKKSEETDLRSWNLSRNNASLELAPYQDILSKMNCSYGYFPDLLEHRDF